MSGIHPEDAMAYADQLHRDLADLTNAVEHIAELLALVLDGERAIPVREYVPLRERRA